MANRTSNQLNVVIAGAGVAALEAALALQDLAGTAVAMSLVSPAREFTYSPAGVLSPFEQKPPRQLPLAKFAAEVGAVIEHGAIESVDGGRRVALVGGRELPFDALVIATGGRVSHPLSGAIAVDPTRMGESLAGLMGEIDRGGLSTVAFVAPRPTWPLPAYELALLVAERARERDLALQVTIITAEPRPLAVFGEAVSIAASELLTEAGIEVVCGSEAEASAEGLLLQPDSRELRFDRVVALPKIAGPGISGLPVDTDGFVPITSGCEVVGADRVYAAGDATSFPVKFGSIAAQQADVAASVIAELAGVDVEPVQFSGVVHGLLLAGATHRRVYFTARIVDGEPLDSRTSDAPTWPVDAKIAARYLGPYLDRLWAEGPRWLAGQLGWEAVLRRLESEITS